MASQALALALNPIIPADPRRGAADGQAARRNACWVVDTHRDGRPRPALCDSKRRPIDECKRIQQVDFDVAMLVSAWVANMGLQHWRRRHQPSGRTATAPIWPLAFDEPPTLAGRRRRGCKLLRDRRRHARLQALPSVTTMPLAWHVDRGQTCLTLAGAPPRPEAHPQIVRERQDHR